MNTLHFSPPPTTVINRSQNLVVHNGIKKGMITNLSQFFDFIPSTDHAHILGVNLPGLILLVRHPEQIQLAYIIKLAEFFDVNLTELSSVLLGRRLTN